MTMSHNLSGAQLFRAYHLIVENGHERKWEKVAKNYDFGGELDLLTGVLLLEPFVHNIDYIRLIKALQLVVKGMTSDSTASNEQLLFDAVQGEIDFLERIWNAYRKNELHYLGEQKVKPRITKVLELLKVSLDEHSRTSGIGLQPLHKSKYCLRIFFNQQEFRVPVGKVEKIKSDYSIDFAKSMIEVDGTLYPYRTPFVMASPAKVVGSTMSGSVGSVAMPLQSQPFHTTTGLKGAQWAIVVASNGNEKNATNGTQDAIAFLADHFLFSAADE